MQIDEIKVLACRNPIGNIVQGRIQIGEAAGLLGHPQIYGCPGDSGNQPGHNRPTRRIAEPDAGQDHKEKTEIAALQPQGRRKGPVVQGIVRSRGEGQQPEIEGDQQEPRPRPVRRIGRHTIMPIAAGNERQDQRQVKQRFFPRHQCRQPDADDRQGDGAGTKRKPLARHLLPLEYGRHGGVCPGVRPAGVDIARGSYGGRHGGQASRNAV